MKTSRILRSVASLQEQLAIIEQRQCGTRQGNTAVSAPLPLVCFQDTTNVTRQRNTAAASVPLVRYHAAKNCSCIWYGIRQRNIAAESVSLVRYQAAKHCSWISVAGMVPGSETLQLHQCRWNGTRQQTLQLHQCRWYGTRQRNIVAESVSLVRYQAAKHCSWISVVGMVPGSETLQLNQCRCYGTRQRNIAAESVSLVWHLAAKHCSWISVAGTVPGSETLQLNQCRCYGTR